MIIDTHCHLHFEAYDADRDEVVRRAREAGVGGVVLVGTDPGTNEDAAKIAGLYPGWAVHSVGMHPHSAHEATPEVLRTLEEQSRSASVRAVGEIGLDFFKSEAPPETQKAVFRKMIRLAVLRDLPIIVHSRNAWEETHAILSEGPAQLRGVMHCFSYDEAAMRCMVDQGFYISFAGNVTYKSASALMDVACATPLDRLVVETDAPYLSPQGFRGQRNEPAYLTETLRLIAERRGVSASSLAECVRRNAEELFRFQSCA